MLTVPNALTVVRLACLPVFVALLAQPHGGGRLAAAFLLAGLGATDGFDGYIARHFNQVSALGKVLDPLVDRALVLTAVIGTIAIRAVPVWLAVIVLVRESVVVVAAAGLALAGATRVEVSWAGKAGSFAMMVALPLFVLGHAAFRGHAQAEVMAWVAAVEGQVLAWTAVAGYFPGARAAFGHPAGESPVPGTEPPQADEALRR